MHSITLACATDDFSKISKNVIFSKMRKKSTLCKIQMFGVFSSQLDQFVTICPSIRYKLHSKPSILKKAIFAFLTKTLWRERQQLRKTTKLLPIKMHIFTKKD